MVHGESGADGQTCIARGGLHVYPLERRVIENFTICDAVKRDSARQAESLLRSSCGESVPMRDYHFFERSLHTRGKIVVFLFQRLVCLARRAEPFFEMR